ncbi:MAG: AzlC family ABC transporter permease [Proteobacteria bacterium]|nr:AzlC family ABC transporter permease [Pseudomonadota bacterium]
MTFDTLKDDLLSGFWAAWPICLGYVPLGLTLGVLGQKAGLSPVEMAVMSLFVFAGSSQFIAVAMIMGNASHMAIIMTTFVVNLRHLLMSSSLSLVLRGKNRVALTIFSHTITDESFVINSEKFKQRSWNLRRAVVVNYTAYASWVISTVTGTYSGRFISENAFGMDYAMTAMFICLLVMQLNGRIHVVTGLISGVIAVGTALYLPGNWYIIIASVLAATLGSIIRTKSIKPEGHHHDE